MTKKIVANRDGEVLGTFYKKGVEVPVNVTQAKYLMSPYDDQLVFAAQKAAPKPVEPKGK